MCGVQVISKHGFCLSPLGSRRWLHLTLYLCLWIAVDTHRWWGQRSGSVAFNEVQEGTPQLAIEVWLARLRDGRTDHHLLRALPHHPVAFFLALLFQFSHQETGEGGSDMPRVMWVSSRSLSCFLFGLKTKCHFPSPQTCVFTTVCHLCPVAVGSS